MNKFGSLHNEAYFEFNLENKIAVFKKIPENFKNIDERDTFSKSRQIGYKCNINLEIIGKKIKIIFE